MDADLEQLFARVPEGWSAVTCAGRRYGLTRTVRATVVAFLEGWRA